MMPRRRYIPGTCSAETDWLLTGWAGCLPKKDRTVWRSAVGDCYFLGKEDDISTCNV